jgi:hypothetical protein
MLRPFGSWAALASYWFPPWPSNGNRATFYARCGMKHNIQIRDLNQTRFDGFALATFSNNSETFSTVVALLSLNVDLDLD